MESSVSFQGGRGVGCAVQPEDVLGQAGYFVEDLAEFVQEHSPAVASLDPRILTDVLETEVFGRLYSRLMQYVQAEEADQK